MKRALMMLGGASAVALAAPAMAQMDHSAHGGHGSSAPTATCSAEHAAMGHCSVEADHSAHQGHGDHADHSAHAEHQAHQGHGDHAGHGTMDHSAHQAADAHSGHGAEAGHDAHAGNGAVDDHAAVQSGAAACTAEHAAMGHCTLPSGRPDLPQIGTNLPAGDAPAPPPPATWMADAIWGGHAMEHSRHQMMVENGGQKFKFFRLDSEYASQKGRDSIGWGAEFWWGGDINRVVVKSDGEIARGEGLEEADIQLLYSRAIDAYFNVQAGVRQDLEGDYKRSYATIGVEGLAPYWLEVEAAAFLSDKGDVTAHIEAEYDQRLTQKWILQPSMEIGLSAQNVAEKGKGSGVTDISLGLRLRYEFVRAFAPYVGVEWGRKFGGTADYSRFAGEKVEATKLVFGLKTWF